jgi:CheY-like chemotaxis protein
MEDELTSRTRVLVADDERIIASTLGAILETAGFESRVVFSGEEAVEVAMQFRPDILLTDYSMGQMNGMQAAEKIVNALPACRIVLFSGQTLTSELTPYKVAGYNFVLLSKPVPPPEIIRALKDTTPVATGHKSPIVLAVDDKEPHLYSVSRMLARAGFTVTQASTGAAGIKKALEVVPDVVLLDLRLPDIDGYDVCKELKANPKTANVTVVHLTASDKTPEAEERSVSVGADEYLTQPIDPKRLVTRLRSLIQAKYLRDDIEK